MKRTLLFVALLALLLFVPPGNAKHVVHHEDGSVSVVDLPTGRTTIAPSATLASYAIYPRPSSLSNLLYRQVIEVHNPSSVTMNRPIEVTLNLHDAAYYTTLVLTDVSGNVIPFQVLSYTDSDGDNRLESVTILFVASIPAGGTSVFFLYYDNSDENTPLHNSVTDYVNEIYGLEASFNTRLLTSSGSLSSQRTGISVSRTPIYQNDDTFGDPNYGSSNTVIGAVLTVTIGNLRYILHFTPKYVHNGQFDYDHDGSAEAADGYTFREGLQVIQYYDGTKRVDIVRYEPIFNQGTSGSYGRTEDIFSPFVFESHAFVLDTDGDGDLGNDNDPLDATPDELKGTYVDYPNPFTIHVDDVNIVVGPVMIAINGEAIVVPMNYIRAGAGSLVGVNNYEDFYSTSLKEDVSYVFYYNTPFVKLHRKLMNTGTSSVRLSDSYSFLNTQPLLHHVGFSNTALINDPFGYPGDVSADTGMFFQLHTRYDMDGAPPYTTSVVRSRNYGLADILGSSPQDKYVYLGRSSNAPSRSSSYPPAIIGMFLTLSTASGLKYPDGTSISDPFNIFYSRSISYGRIYSATTNRYDTDGQYATASIGMVTTDNAGLILNAGGYIEGEIMYAIYYGSQASVSAIANVNSILKNQPNVANDPSGPKARQSSYNLTITVKDLQGDVLKGSIDVFYSGNLLFSVALDSDGSTILKLGANGTYTIRFHYDTIYGEFVQEFSVIREVNGSNHQAILVANVQDVDVAIKYPDGTSVSGVQLLLYGVNSTYTGQNTEQLLYNITLASGTFHVEDLPEGYYRIMFYKDINGITVTEEHVVHVNSTYHSFTYYLDVAKLDVYVYDPDGSPIVGASVSVQAYNGSQYITLYTGTTDSSGHASFLRVPLTNQTDGNPIKVIASYELYGVSMSSSDTVDLQGDSSISLTIDLYDLTISVYDNEGIPAANGTIAVTITYADGQSASFSFDDYKFTIENLPSAEYTSSTSVNIEITYSIHDVSVSYSTSITFTNDYSLSVTLSNVWNVTFSVGYYSGTSRVPLSGATVEVYTPGGSLIVTLQTDNSGKAELHGLPYGLDYEVHAIYSFYNVPITHVQAFNNTASKEIEIAYKVVTISIHVSALSGEDVNGAKVEIYYSGTKMIELTTGSDGYASYFPFPSSIYVDTSLVSIHVSYSAYGRLVEKTVTGVDRNSTISVALNLGRIDATVRLADGRSDVPIHVDVSDSLPVTSFDAVGNFSVQLLPTGVTYTVTVSYTTSYGTVVSISRSVSLNDVATVSFEIPVGTVGFHVVDAEGNAIAGAHVEATFGGLTVSGATDTNGYVYFTDVPLSSYVGAISYKALIKLFGTEVNFSGSATMSNGTVVSITLDVGNLKIHVEDAEGTSLAGATVTLTINGVSQQKDTDSNGNATFYAPIGVEATVEASYSISGLTAEASKNITTSLSGASIAVPVGHVTIKVYDTEGNVLSGIDVSIEISGVSLHATTGADGSASFYTLINTTATITASYSDYGVSSSKSVTLLAGHSYSITLPLGHIKVNVYDAEGSALSGLPVSVEIGSLSFSDTTDENGTASFYVVTGVEGTITVSYAEFNVELSRNVTLVAGESYDFSLPIGHVTINVYDLEGNALSGIKVSVDIGSLHFEGVTSGGSVELYVRLGENATITASYSDYGVSSTAYYVLEVGHSYSITLPLGHIKVNVYDAEESPLVGASVVASYGLIQVSSTTDAHGTASLYLAIGVNASIRVSYNFNSFPITSSAYAVTELDKSYNFTLPLGHIYVKALTYNEEPIAGVKVYVDIGSLHLEATTGTDGIATIYTLVNVSATITVVSEEYSLSAAETLTIHAGETYTFYLSLSYVTIYVYDYDGNAISGATVAIDVSGYHVETTTVNGSVRVATIVNTTATVKVSYETIYGFTVSVSQSFNFVRDGVYTIKLPLASLNVTVQDALGEPLAAAKVQLSYQGTIFASVATGTDGQVSIIQVPVGTPVDLLVEYKTPYGVSASYFETLTLSGPESKLVQLRIGRLTLHFTDLMGKPLSGLKLSISYQNVSVQVPVSNDTIVLERFPIGMPFNFTAYGTFYGLNIRQSTIISLSMASEEYTIAMPVKDVVLAIVNLANKPVPMSRVTMSYESVGVFYSTTVLNGSIKLKEFPVARYLGSLTITASYLSSLGFEVEGKSTIESPATYDVFSVKIGIKPVKIYVTDISGEPTSATVYIKRIGAQSTIALSAFNGSVSIADFPLSLSPANITAVHTVRGINGVTLDVVNSVTVDFTAQSSVTIQLQLTDLDVKVTDRNGNPLEGAIVTIKAGNLEFKATTGADGIAHFEDIPTLSYLGISAYHVSIDYGGVITETDVYQSGGSTQVKAKTPSDVMRERLIAGIVITVAVMSIVAYKFIIKARPPYYRLKKAIEKGAEEIDLERLPTREEELMELFEESK